MSANEKISVTVEIYGSKYKLLAESDSTVDHVRQVAAYVDSQMKRIAEHFPKLDISRLAVLSAINIADQFMKSKENLQQEEYVKTAATEELSHIQAQYSEVTAELERLQAENELLHQQLMKQTARKETASSVEENYEKLKEEYAKLQNEYNEWIQLVEEPNN